MAWHGMAWHDRLERRVEIRGMERRVIAMNDTVFWNRTVWDAIWCKVQGATSQANSSGQDNTNQNNGVLRTSMLQNRSRRAGGQTGVSCKR